MSKIGEDVIYRSVPRGKRTIIKSTPSQKFFTKKSDLSEEERRYINNIVSLPKSLMDVMAYICKYSYDQSTGKYRGIGQQFFTNYERHLINMAIKEGFVEEWVRTDKERFFIPTVIGEKLLKAAIKMGAI